MNNIMLPDFRVRQRDYLLEIIQALTQELDLDKLLGRILNISIEMVAGQAGLIALRSDIGKWRVLVSKGLPPAFLHYIEPYLNEIPQDENDPESIELALINRLLQELAYSASFGLLTGVGLPLVTRKTVLGVIFIFRGYKGGFSVNDRTLLRSFADQAAIAVNNALLYTQVNREKQRLDALLNAGADGILILTSDQRIERCNHAFARLYGLTAQELQNQHHEEIIRWCTPPNGITLEQAVAGGWPLTPNAKLYVEGDLILNKGQQSLPVGVTYAPLLTQDGTLLNTIVNVRDITRFRQADELKSMFISIISHELKTPVALIKGYVGTLRREDAHWDPDIIQDSLAVIEEEADHLTEMIENLLDASRLQAGGLPMKRSDVWLPGLTKRLAEKFKTQTSHHQIITEFPEDFPVILADETRIQQVLSNLISNAIKYAPEGDIRVTGQTRAENIIICVSDQGPGIAPGDIPHVFESFYRASDMIKHTKGAGLGLYLARAIIESHGGRIWVDPESGKGARICFSLPRHLDND